MTDSRQLALEALQDIRSGWVYIRQSHGDLYGVGYEAKEMLEYGDSKAAHARNQTLEDVIAELEGMTCNNATARSAIKLCIEAIKEMK